MADSKAKLGGPATIPMAGSYAVLFTPFAVINMLMVFSYVLIRLSPLNGVLFSRDMGGDGGVLSMRESETKMFLMMIILFKARRAENLEGFLATAFLLGKVFNAYMFWHADALYAVVYVLVCGLLAVFLPVPVYKGPDKTVPLSDDKLLTLLADDKAKGTNAAPKFLIVNLFCTWSPPCQYMTRDFAAVSLRYSAACMRFARIDIGRFVAVAKTYKIDTHVRSAQVPTIILFKNGEELDRRPKVAETTGIVEKCKFSQQFIEVEFRLDKLLGAGVSGASTAATSKNAKKNA